ncbi:MAG TPA: TonB-dependent receptor [Candidatus Acidoferrales bacterium]|nr:TonB-dependent receptor [Candidatus Acidoferrales bacterium]
MDHKRRGAAALLLMAGAWTTAVHAQGNAGGANSVSPTVKEPSRARLAPADSCVLEGVTRSSSGLPLAQTRITVRRLNDGVTHNVVSGANGQYLIFDLTPGSYELTANKPDFITSAKVTVELAPQQNLRVDLTLKAAPAGDATETAGTPSSMKPSDKTDTEKYLLEEVQRLEARLADLEARLASQPAVATAAPSAAGAALDTVTNNATAAPASAGAPPATTPSQPQTDASATPAVQASAAVKDPAAASAKPAPFSDADWSWLNGNPRTKDIFWDSAFFTPEIRSDVDYVYDFNHPTDHSMGGSSELFRSQEVQLEQLGVGGDFHWDNVRARLMTQFGMYSVTTPRNDPSPGNGQWDLADAYRYVSEAYGGYHFNVLDGVNVDAGIFMSYVGLFSYYNFDNWAYQPSYVSSNTPWFFNGVRVQVFLNKHLKIEPWFINGWQAYGSANHTPGLGGQLKWTPTSYINVISNNYGLGEDDLFVPHRKRIHTDNSIEVKYYDRPDDGLDKMAFTLTGDLGCEYGSGVSCYGNRPGGPKQSFAGYMIYNRFWFHKDLFGLTVGGGHIDNPGRYLVLLPPINGESAISAATSSPYFTENPGDPFKAWDSSLTFDYMPKQYITFRWEYDYRHASVPYWSGPGGITPPGGNNNFPQFLTCSNGSSSGQGTLAAAEAACGGGLSSVWFPDLRKNESFIDMSILIKF